LALFTKVIRKISKRLVDVQKAAIDASMPGPAEKTVVLENLIKTDGKPIEASMADELEEAGDAETRALREKQRAMISSLDIGR
jgi:N-acetyltransferase 10